MTTAAMSLSTAAGRARERRRRAAELIASASIEMSPRDDPARERLDELLASGTEVFVYHPAGVTHHDIVAACAQLGRAGFAPVPHVAARRLASFTQARDFVQRAAAEAGVTSLLLTAGDPVRPLGPFADSLELLASGLVEGSGIARVFFAGYPEGHPAIDRRDLDRALRAKLMLARERGLAAALVTQFGFAAGPPADWVAALREDGVACPVRVGVAGPAPISTLARIAVRCGIGSSLRELGRGQAAFARILDEAAPDELIDALAAAERPGAAFDGVHLYSFGGVQRTAGWLRARIAALGRS